MKLKVNFIVEKTTPGAVRFQETDDKGQPLKIGDGAKVGTLYVRKSALGKDIPNNLTVELSY